MYYIAGISIFHAASGPLHQEGWECLNPQFNLTKGIAPSWNTSASNYLGGVYEAAICRS